MKRIEMLLVGLVLVGCGQSVRKEAEKVWYLKGNLLLTTSEGKQQLQVEMYGEKNNFWVIEGRDPLLSGRLFWFLATAAGTNYFIYDVQRQYLFFVDREWAGLFVEGIPLFLERDESDSLREAGWLTTYQKGQWQATVKKRFQDGMPRILLVDGGGERFFLDLQKIEKRPYHIPRYDHVSWREVHVVSGGGIWEVIYEQ
ncbi:MAG: hypothetical protein N2314_08700 [Brevinematales bacterium]|nr:hypothetical protein [Brevinematales bacterium]